VPLEVVEVGSHRHEAPGAAVTISSTVVTATTRLTVTPAQTT
jgi:hypothetical protein